MQIMTWKQYGEAAVHEFRRRVLGHPLAPYLPDYTRCCDHFIMHAGGPREGGWVGAGPMAAAAHSSMRAAQLCVM